MFFLKPVLCLVFVFFFAQVLCHSTHLLVPQAFSIEFQVRNRNLEEILLDGVANKLETGELNAISRLRQSNHMYTYSSGRVFSLNEEACQWDESGLIPPNLWTFDNVTLIPSSVPSYDKEVNNCKIDPITGRYLDTKIWRFQYLYEPFVICTRISAVGNSVVDVPFKIVGENVVVELNNFFPFRINEEINRLANKASSCRKHEIDETILEQLRRVSEKGGSDWFSDFKKSCRFKWIADEKVCKDFETRRRSNLEEPKKLCVFLHGSGNRVVGEPSSLFEEYWGKVSNFTPQCSERIFVKEDTVNNGWDSLDLQQKFCSVALYKQPKGEKMIKNKIIFSHSLGNLVLAAAIRNSFCDIDTTTTSWYNIQGPQAGTKAGSFIIDVCKGATDINGTKITKEIYNMVAEKLGYCIPNSNETYPVYKNLSPDIADFKEFSEIISTRTSGGMCGVSAYGLNSFFSIPLSVLSNIVSYGEDNDGLVPFSSCASGLGYQKFIPDYRANYYTSTTNHADGTCRNGNGVYGIQRKPCSYYTDKL